MTTKAAFALEGYNFHKVIIDYKQDRSNEVKLNFKPSGTFKITENTAIYELSLTFTAKSKEAKKPLVEIECNALFKFAEVISFEQIPTYFYGNSIAIIFPYIRAFISTVTLQANYRPMVLPTMNLSDLGDPLKAQTIDTTK